MKKRYFNYLFFILILIILITPSVFAIDYNNLCGEEGINSAIIIIGKVVLIMKIVVPLIIIVLGMVDFGKAVISDDEKAVSKATTTLIRRLIAGLVVFFIPLILLTIIKAININDDIEKTKCITCILDVNDFGCK